MLSYYGSKVKLAKYYPLPKYDLIIEPFAGMGHYSMLHWRKQIHLNDIYSDLVEIWNYLQFATQEQILNLPQLKKGDDIRRLDLPRVERNLLGFMIHRGVSSPVNIYTGWAAESDEVERTKKRIINNFHKIRHFKITNKDYRELENVEATWFIDPPYQYGKVYKYVYHHMDYDELADWCRSRKGQVIVCENHPAAWLDFKYFKQFYGQRKETTELIWTNDLVHIEKPAWLGEEFKPYKQTRLFDF